MPILMGTPYTGFRSLPFVPVDSWEPTMGDRIFIDSKGYITAPIRKTYFADPSVTPIDIFYLNTKRCYNNTRDHIAKYLNYFEKFYDAEKELLAVYVTMKLRMDMPNSGYTPEVFFDDLRRYILSYNSRIFAKVNQMNEENYCLRLGYKNNRNPALQYNEDHAKLLMRSSVLMNLIIPLITHYMHVSKILNVQEFILNIFTYILRELCDGINLIEKLNETTTTNVYKHKLQHPVLWEIQDIRGYSPQNVAINAMENIIVTIMPKYNYQQNIVHLNYKAILNGLRYQITDIQYEYTYVTLSSTKRDDDNNSEFDKFESLLVKESESDYMIINANYKREMEVLLLNYGPIDDEEIVFYHEELSNRKMYEVDENGRIDIVQDDNSNHSCINGLQKTLIFNLFMNVFKTSYSLKEINYKDYIRLIIIAKKILLKHKLYMLAYFISGSIETAKVRGINAKEKARIEASNSYAQVKKKYNGNEAMMEHVISLISNILASRCTIIDYDNEFQNGQPLEIINEIMIENVLDFILMI